MDYGIRFIRVFAISEDLCISKRIIGNSDNDILLAMILDKNKNAL